MILYGDDRYVLENKAWSFSYTKDGVRVRVASVLALFYSFYPVWLIMRILRIDLSGAFCNKHGFGFFCLGKLYFYNLEKKAWQAESDFNCKRPLKIDFNDEYLYFGDYTSNPDRKEKIGVYKYAFRTSKLVEIYTYRDVRHVHSVKRLTDEQILVLCGDYGEEARMTFLDMKGHKKFELKNKDDDQMVRAVDCCYDGKSLYYGTDTQIEQNYLCKYAFDNDQIERLAKLEGPVFNIFFHSPDVIVFTVGCEVGLPNVSTMSIYSYNLKSSELKQLYGYSLPLSLNKFLQTLFGIPGFDIHKKGDEIIISNNYYFNIFRKQCSIRLSGRESTGDGSL